MRWGTAKNEVMIGKWGIFHSSFISTSVTFCRSNHVDITQLSEWIENKERRQEWVQCKKARKLTTIPNPGVRNQNQVENCHSSPFLISPIITCWKHQPWVSLRPYEIAYTAFSTRPSKAERRRSVWTRRRRISFSKHTESRVLNCMILFILTYRVGIPNGTVRRSPRTSGSAKRTKCCTRER